MPCTLSSGRIENAHSTCSLSDFILNHSLNWMFGKSHSLCTYKLYANCELSYPNYTQFKRAQTIAIYANSGSLCFRQTRELQSVFSMRFFFYPRQSSWHLKFWMHLFQFEPVPQPALLWLSRARTISMITYLLRHTFVCLRTSNPRHGAIIIITISYSRALIIRAQIKHHTAQNVVLMALPVSGFRFFWCFALVTQ